MKEHVLSAGKWIAILILVALVGFLAVLKLGRKRGGRLQRLRVNVWVAIVGIIAGGGIFVTVMTACGGKSKNSPPPALADAGVSGSQGGQGEDAAAAGDEAQVTSDVPLAQPSCYSPPPCYVPPPGDLTPPTGPAE